jgi:6-phosphogluconolactonase/glucosamine-6-phosphate isomerase/deaminase
MKYIHSKNAAPGIVHMSRFIADHLKQGKTVLWFISGGSNIPHTVQALYQISDVVSNQQWNNLFIALTDERYGPVGHADSNWHQITFELSIQQFDISQINTIPILRDLPLDRTVEEYSHAIHEASDSVDVIVGQLGIGADGHIAGILPHSGAIDTIHMAHGYIAQPFTRITLSMKALREIDVAYVFVFGESKLATLKKLYDENAPLEEQPAQILKELKEVYVYEDVVE